MKIINNTFSLKQGEQWIDFLVEKANMTSDMYEFDKKRTTKARDSLAIMPFFGADQKQIKYGTPLNSLMDKCKDCGKVSAPRDNPRKFFWEVTDTSNICNTCNRVLTYNMKVQSTRQKHGIKPKPTPVKGIRRL